MAGGRSTGDDVWAVVPGTGGRYEASEDGRVRTSADGTPLEPRPGGPGYPQVVLDLGRHKVRWPVAACVLSAFVGPRPTPAHRAAYLDGDNTNVGRSNLAWLTPAECGALAARLGRARRRPVRVVGGVPHYQCNRCRAWKAVGEFGRMKAAGIGSW